jgi:rSAM/selenodomain-associated transferase 1
MAHPADPAEARIAIFARAPVAGNVKTRLIPLLGSERAAALHAVLLTRTIETALDAGVGPIELWCEPSADHPAFQVYIRRYAVTALTQSRGDLGQRMVCAASRALQDKSRIIIIGSDCAAMDGDDLRNAARLLACRDAVLMPAEDGGYALIGLARCHPALFSGVDWGTERVLAQTRGRLAGLNFRWSELRSTWDVDRPDDFDRLLASDLIPDLESRLADCGT